MRPFNIIACFILICLNGYGQQLIQYKVIYNSIPIQTNPYGEVLIKVPKNKVLTVLSYDPVLKCYKGKYKEVFGCINTI
jgi:hypothetical protein